MWVMLRKSVATYGLVGLRVVIGYILERFPRVIGLSRSPNRPTLPCSVNDLLNVMGGRSLRLHSFVGGACLRCRRCLWESVTLRR